MIRDYDSRLEAFAAEVGPEGPVTVRGGSTRWDVGGPPDPGTREVTAPVGIVEHRPDEMTVTVFGGTTVADLHASLAAAGQRTALPERPAGTVGGALAVGQNHIARPGRGRTRDALLQVVYISAEADLVTAGGPTVKNVSGFDIPRLIVGSLGTLGLIAEVILRTQPIPEREIWVAADRVDPARVAEVACTSASVLWDGTTTWALLAGHPSDVDTDISALADIGQFQAASVPDLPPHRWSRTPSDALVIDRDATGGFVVEVQTGLVHAHRPDTPGPRPDAVVAIERRLKDRFDPTGRLNPGRRPGAA